MKTKEKAKKSFNYQCKRASVCRHEKYQKSCYSCPQFDICDIQRAIEKARKKM